MPWRAGIYARISDDREGAGLGVARQEEDGRELCVRLGWDVAEVYTDNDLSAYKGRRRPGYERLLADLAAGAINAVVAWHPDRLHRSPVELEHFITVVETAKAKVATVTAGTYDLSTPSGRMVARTLGNAARYESEHKAERIRRKHREIAEAGRRPGGGNRQFGYTADGTELVADEADLIRQAARRVLDGETVRGVCADWNRRGVPTVTGRSWTQHVLRRILTAPSTAGQREHNGTTYTGTWPPILDLTTHKRLRLLLLDPARRTNGTARRYLLAGFLVCGRCGARMVARPRADKQRAYVCASGPGFHGCGRMGVLAEPLEAEVAELLFEWVDVPAVERAVGRARDDTSEQAVLDAIQRDEAELEQLAVDRADGLITRGQMLAATQRLSVRVAAARRQLVRQHDERTAAAWDGQGGALRAAWGSWPLDRKRAMLATYVESVTIAPAVPGLNRFDRDRLTPERGGGVGWRR
jgi:DNA invertase Pin-like site-specific DNA recombinase